VVLDHDSDCLLEGVGRAELDELGTGEQLWRVSGWGVVGVSRLVGLLPGGVVEGHFALEHVTPVQALAAVIGQPAEELGKGLESEL
jgi:hypothetical protein